MPPVVTLGSFARLEISAVLCVYILLPRASATLCKDEPGWENDYGDCSSYSPEGDNAGYCVDDDVTSCPQSCGMCDWQVADPGNALCNAWRLTAHQAGWADATIHIQDDDGNVQIDGFQYLDDSLVEAGAATICLHPSRCYQITVQGPLSAQWSLHDTLDEIVAEGLGPASQKLCPCGVCPPTRPELSCDFKSSHALA